MLPVASGDFPENASAADFYLLENLMTEYIRNEIRTELEAEFSGEIHETISSILEAEGLSEARILRDAH